MKVYLVLEHCDYEGFCIEGVYSSRAEAEKHLATLKARTWGKGDDQTIEEREVSESFLLDAAEEARYAE